MNGLRRMFATFTGRMVLAAFATHVLLAVSVGYGACRIISGDLKDEFVNTVRTQVRQIALSVAGGAATADGIGAMLQDGLWSGQLVYAELVLDDGRVLPQAGGLNQGGRRFVEDFRFDEHEGEAYFISAHVRPASGAPGGTLRLGFDKRPTLERIGQLYQHGMLLILGYLAVSVLLAWVAGVLLGRSIRRLRDAARRVAAGRTEEPLEVTTGIAEVASLTSDLELMRTELVRQQHALRRLAYFDDLTGLANRALLGERLGQALAAARTTGETVAVLYLDLDRFKRVNDTSRRPTSGAAS